MAPVMTARTKILSRLSIYLGTNFLDKIAQYLYDRKGNRKTKLKKEEFDKEGIKLSTGIEGREDRESAVKIINASQLRFKEQN